jgi:hypothetical protein
MKLEDTILNDAEKAAAQKWMTKHQASCSGANFEVDTIVGGYGYRVRVWCMACGTREDVTDQVAHGGYPHR